MLNKTTRKQAQSADSVITDIRATFVSYMQIDTIGTLSREAT